MPRLPGRVALFIPTYQRPHRIEPLIADLRQTTGPEHPIYFIVEPSDADTRQAVEKSSARMILNQQMACYAGAINTAYAVTDEPFFLAGADDIEPLPGWLEACLSAFAEPRIGVAGIRQDNQKNGNHATHYVMRRSYVDRYGGTIDRSGPVMHLYHHGYTDWETVITAKVRGAYRLCYDATLRHHHPGWRIDGRVDPDSERFDATYAKANATLYIDTMTLALRSKLFLDAFERMPDKNHIDRRFLRQIHRFRRYYWLHRLGIRESALHRIRRFYPRVERMIGPPV